MLSLQEVLVPREVDGYLSATLMCKAYSKKLNHWLSNQATSDLVSELSTETGIPVSNLVQVSKGGESSNQGTWIHPKLAIPLAQWLDPKFALWVSDLVIDWFAGHKTTRVDDEVEAQLDYNTNTVTLKLPFESLGRLTDAISTSKPKPQPTGWLFPDTPAATDPPDSPNLRYDFAAACEGMHGWYTAEEVAEVIGCSKDTVHARNKLNRLPQGWTGKYKQGKIWVWIP